MKISPYFRLKNVLVLSTFVGIAAIFQSCKVNDDVPGPVQDVAALTIINASPNSNGLDFYIENQKVNATAFLYPLRIPYQRVYAGTRIAKVTASNNSTKLFSDSLSLETNQYHSLFIVGNVESLGFLLLKDDLSFPPSGETKIRFGNLSPDAPAVSLEIVGDTTTFVNRAYKAFTGFKAIKPGKFTLLLKDNATNATLATMENVEFAADKVYTVWAKGLVTTTTDAQKLNLHIINHDI